MDINNFSNERNNEMVNRIAALKEEKQWDISEFDTVEKIAKEIKRLSDSMYKKDMPSFYYENIDKRIDALKEKQKTLNSKKEVSTEKSIVTEAEFLKEMKNIDNTSKTIDESYQRKMEYINSIETDILSEDVIVYGLQNKKLSESRLPRDPSVDPEFGVPEEKKYPLYDKKHVESAIRLFGHVNPKYEKSLAGHIKSKMEKYGISKDTVGEDNKLYKYLTEAHRDDSEVVRLTKEIKDNVKRLEDLGINTKDILDKEKTEIFLGAETGLLENPVYAIDKDGTVSEVKNIKGNSMRKKEYEEAKENGHIVKIRGKIEAFTPERNAKGDPKGHLTDSREGQKVGTVYKTFYSDTKMPTAKSLKEDGHLSKDMTIEEVAKKHNVSVEELEKQVKMGIKVEHEHTSNDEDAKRIALDHLYEFPDYYTRLEKMEKEGEAELKEAVETVNFLEAYLEGDSLFEEYNDMLLTKYDLDTLIAKHSKTFGSMAKTILAAIAGLYTTDSRTGVLGVDKKKRALISAMVYNDKKIMSIYSELADLLKENASKEKCKAKWSELKRAVKEKIKNEYKSYKATHNVKIINKRGPFGPYLAKVSELSENNITEEESETSLSEAPYYKVCPKCGAHLDPGERCEDCEGKVKVFQSEKEQDTKKETNKKELSESVLDPVQKERCREIFDSEDKMLPEVKKQILDRFFEWKDGLEEKFTVDNVYLIGSSSGFQYTPSSDVDVTVIAHDYTDEIWDKVKDTMPNGNNLEGTEHPVNYFIRPDMNDKAAENIYDIQNDTWLKKTDKAVIDIHMPYIVEMARFFMNAFDLSLNEYERDKMDYLQLKELDPEKVEISAEERANALAAKLTELRADLDSIRMGNHILRGFLHEAYEEEDGIFEIHIEIKGGDDPRLSPNNLVYKLLERYGYREKIDNTIKEAEEFIAQEDSSLQESFIENFLLEDNTILDEEMQVLEESLRKEFPNKEDRRNWKLIVKSMNYIDIASFDKTYPNLAKLGKHEKIKKLKQALYNLPHEKKIEILEKAKPAIDNALKKIVGRKRAGKIVQGPGSALGGITGATVGADIGVSSALGGITSAGSLALLPLAACFGFIGGLAIGVLPTLIVGGALRDANTKRQAKDIAMKSHDAILKDLKLEIEDKKSLPVSTELSLAEASQSVNDAKIALKYDPREYIFNNTATFPPLRVLFKSLKKAYKEGGSDDVYDLARRRVEKLENYDELKELASKIDAACEQHPVDERKVKELFRQFKDAYKHSSLKKDVDNDIKIEKINAKRNLTEAVTFVDNAGQVKTMSAEDYVKDMHEYHTETQVPEYSKPKKVKKYRLIKTRKED